jgi:hypothetical protein
MGSLGEKWDPIDQIELKEEQRGFLPCSKNDRRCSSLKSDGQRGFNAAEEAMDYLARILVNIYLWRKKHGQYERGKE